MVLQTIKEYIRYCETELSDPRTKNYFIISNPFFTIGLIVAYLLLVKNILPSFMKNRRPYKLKSAIFYYNIVQVIMNMYIVYLSYGSGFIRRFHLLKCRDVDISDTDPDALMAFRAVYYYFILKYTEFLDTIFFALRKKDNQISFLHVYHHSSMVVNSWLAFKFVPGGGTTHVTGLNAFIHVVMYTYYLLSGLGPKWQKYLWWKKYLTTIQIVQFKLGLFLLVCSLYTYDNCPLMLRNSAFISYMACYSISMLYLFSQFYSKTYQKSSKTIKNKTQKIE